MSMSFAPILLVALFDLTPPAESPRRVTAEELIESFYSNTARVDEYYLDKKIVVTGLVHLIGKDWIELPRASNMPREYQNRYIMALDLGTTGKRTRLELRLIFSENHRKQLADLQAGQPVAISGICRRDGQSATIELIDCKLLPTK